MVFNIANRQDIIEYCNANMPTLSQEAHQHIADQIIAARSNPDKKLRLYQDDPQYRKNRHFGLNKKDVARIIRDVYIIEEVPTPSSEVMESLAAGRGAHPKEHKDHHIEHIGFHHIRHYKKSHHK
jgi:hypothetical protein